MVNFSEQEREARRKRAFEMHAKLRERGHDYAAVARKVGAERTERRRSLESRLEAANRKLAENGLEPV